MRSFKKHGALQDRQYRADQDSKTNEEGGNMEQVRTGTRNGGGQVYFALFLTS